jgi:hypothetical protein
MTAIGMTTSEHGFTFGPAKRLDEWSPFVRVEPGQP